MERPSNEQKKGGMKNGQGGEVRNKKVGKWQSNEWVAAERTFEIWRQSDLRGGERKEDKSKEREGKGKASDEMNKE